MIGMAAGDPSAMPNSTLLGALGMQVPLPEPMIALMGLSGAAVLLRRRAARAQE